MKKLFYLVGFFMCIGCWMTEPQSYSPASMTPLEVVGVIDVVSIINSDKTLVDHAGSWMSGYDCSTPRAELTGGAWCIKPPAPYVPPPQPVCYRTLADVDCYPLKQGDPFEKRLPVASPLPKEILEHYWN